VLRIRDVLSRIRILDPGGKKAPDPGSDLFFFIKAINKLCLLIPDPDPTIAPSWIRISDPGGKKAPDLGYDLFFL
jgi:hypothetical protein